MRRFGYALGILLLTNILILVCNGSILYRSYRRDAVEPPGKGLVAKLRWWWYTHIASVFCSYEQHAVMHYACRYVEDKAPYFESAELLRRLMLTGEL